MGMAACWRKVRTDFGISLPFSPIFSRSGSAVWIPACAGMTGLGRDSAGPEEGSGGCGGIPAIARRVPAAAGRVGEGCC